MYSININLQYDNLRVSSKKHAKLRTFLQMLLVNYEKQK